MARTKLEIENRIGCTHTHFSIRVNTAFAENVHTYTSIVQHRVQMHTLCFKRNQTCKMMDILLAGTHMVEHEQLYAPLICCTTKDQHALIRKEK